MAAETTTRESNNKKNRESTILIIAIVAPIALALLVSGGPAIIKGITQIVKVIIPNFWVIVAYGYVALIGVLIGRRSRK